MVVLLEVFILDVRDGDGDLVDVGVDLAVQGDPHPPVLTPCLRVTFTGRPIFSVLKCKLERASLPLVGDGSRFWDVCTRNLFLSKPGK